MDEDWAEYLEALRVLRRAPEVARTRLDRIDADAAQATRAADEALRHTVGRRETLERRLRDVDELLRTALAEREIRAAGPPPAVRLPRPTTLDQALDALDQIERQVREDIARVDAARLPAARLPPPRRWRRYVLAGVGAIAIAVVAVTVLFAIS